MYPIRLFWNLAAIGGAIAVGVITHDAGLIAVTFLGGLLVPRLLGLAPRGGMSWWGRGGCYGGDARGRLRSERFETWHREAHSGAPAQPQPASGPAQS
jgi:hypothetical protein